MIFLLLPLFGVLAGIGAGLIVRVYSVAAAIGAALVPAILLYAFAVYRAGAEIIPHPGVWILVMVWMACVGAGYFVTTLRTRPR